MSTAVATVMGGGRSGHHWKNDSIVSVEVPDDLFSFLFVTVLNVKDSTIMLVALVFGLVVGGGNWGKHWAGTLWWLVLLA